MYDILNVYLENGLRVVIHRIPYMRTMSCGIWVKQGSKHENDLNNGLSHLIEHLKINTDKSVGHDFQRLIQEVTAGGVVYNANTSKESTCFYFTGLSVMLDKCVEALACIAIDNSKFSTELIENEKKVVIQESISFYSSFNQIKERMSQALWGNIGIGKIIVGDIENIKKTSSTQIEEIIEGAYTPENSTIIVIGGVDYQKTIDLIEKSFSRWQDKETRQFKEMVDSEPGIYFNPAASGKSIAVSIGFRTGSYLDKERFNIDVITKVLGDTSLESRLAQEIRIKRGLAYNVGAFTSFYEQRGSLGFTAVCSRDSVNEVVKIMIDEFNKVKLKGFTIDEINRAKKILETKTLLDLDNLTSQLKFLGKCSSYGQLFSLEQEIREIRNIKGTCIQETAKDIFKNENMSLALIGECDLDSIIPLLTIEQ